MNKLGIVFFPAYDWSISVTHPERQERLLYTSDQLFEEGIDDMDNVIFYNPVKLSIEDVKRVHFVVNDVVSDSHLIAAGGVYNSYKAQLDQEVDKAFALVRPPGHHAFQLIYGDKGFCIINVNAVALAKIRKKYGNLKVAIIDTDAHHGDGNQDIYYNDKNTLVISIHQDGRTLYPGSGFIDELGGPNAYGLNINVPLLPNSGDQEILYVIDNLVKPILEDFKPDLIVNLAGQDNHYSDPLTNMNFSANGYAKLTEKLNADIAVLEGGYSIESALPYINLAIILAMLKEDYSYIYEPDYQEIKTDSNLLTYTKELCEKILYNYNNRHHLAKEKYLDKKIIKEDKSIYYDTDNIHVDTTTTYMLCDKCSGYEYIEAKSTRYPNTLAITINRDSCSKCETLAYKLYNQDKVKTYIKDFKNEVFK